MAGRNVRPQLFQDSDVSAFWALRTGTMVDTGTSDNDRPTITVYGPDDAVRDRQLLHDSHPPRHDG